MHHPTAVNKRNFRPKIKQNYRDTSGPKHDYPEVTDQIITVADLRPTIDLMMVPDKCTGPDSLLITKTTIFSTKNTSRFDLEGRRRRIGSKNRPTFYTLQ